MNDRKFDLIVIGAGFAGMVAACRAGQLGLKAAVLEKESNTRHVCSSRFATGVFAVMSKPVPSPAEELAQAILEGTDGTARPELARAVAFNAKRAADWLTQEGARFITVPTASGKNLMLAPPRRFREGLDWEGRGPDVLLRKLEQNLASRGGQVVRGTTAKSLVMEKGVCVGVDALQNSQAIRFEAGAVVIADGGFQANPGMVKRYISARPERVLLRAAPGSKGDGIEMAKAAGAAVSGFGAFYGHIHHRDAMINNRLWPYPHFDAMAEVSILVGPDGKRFTDEGLGGVCMTNAIARLEDPLSASIIFDHAMWTGEPGKAGPVAVNPFLLSGGGWTKSAPDIPSLARQADLPADALCETVREYNEAVRHNGLAGLAPPRSSKKSPPLPIATPPYYAVPLCAGLTLTMGGIEIDAHTQALRPDGNPIPGLYVSGTPVSGLEGGPRAGYVGGLCKAFVLGLLAAERIAAMKKGKAADH